MSKISFIYFSSPIDLINQTPNTAERRKLAIVQEILYGHDKVSYPSEIT